MLKAPFPWFGKPPSTGMAIALDLIVQGVLSVDSKGQIWRNAIKNHGQWKRIPPRRAENPSGKGYLRLTLQTPGVQVQVMAHRVVWAVANSQIPPDELQINHDDLNKRNNRPSNLILCTGQQNIQHSYAHGRTLPWSQARKRCGDWRGRPILTVERVDKIRAARDAGAFLKDIAREFEISTTHAHRLTAYREKSID